MSTDSAAFLNRPPVDRSLQRVLRKPEVRQHVLPLVEGGATPRAITDTAGKLLAGDAAALSGAPVEIAISGARIGLAYGDCAANLARVFQALAAEENEIRALGRESLEKYREITMLYSLAEKIIGAPDPSRIANIVCGETLRFLRCDSAALLLVNADTNRLEIIASKGCPFHSRATRDLGEDLIASVLLTGIGEIVNDITGDPRALAADNKLASLVVSTLRSNDKTFGVLVAGSESARHFNAGDLQVLNAIAAHAAAAIEVDRLNRDLAETSRKPIDLIYGVNEVPPVGVSLLLAIQHSFVAILSLAYPVIIVLEAGGDRLAAAGAVSMSLLAMAVGTLAQTFRYGPLGSGYFAPYVTSAIYVSPAIQAARLGGMPLTLGMTVFSGICSLGFSRVLRRYRWLFPPEVSGVVVLMVGLSMVPIALPRFFGLANGHTAANPSGWIVALVTLGTIMLVSVIPVSRIKVYSTAIGFTVGYVLAAAFGLFDAAKLATVKDLPFFGLQSFGFHRLSFDPSLVLPFLAATLASNLSDGGLLISSQKTNDASWTRTDTNSLSGGIVATGISNLAAGLLGGAGTNLSAGSISLASATGATSRRIGVYLAAIFVLLAFMPKVTAMFAMVPAPVLGAGLLYLASNLVSSGMSLIASRMLDARRNFVIGLPLLAGVGMIAMPHLFSDAPVWVGIVASSPLALATILALSLNIVLNAGVGNHASTGLSLDETLNEYVTKFVSRQGASWGARGEVVRRAAPAITEWCEELRQTLGSNSAALDLHFDDYRLTATIRSPDAEARNPTLGGEVQQGTIDRAARNISRRYGCGVRLNTVREIAFDFEH